jgi:cysteine desulfurase
MTKRGEEIELLPTTRQGEVRGIETLSEKTKLLSVIGVGNETGIVHHQLTSHILSTLFPSPKERPLWHTDFVAGWGRVDLDLSLPNSPDLVAIAGQKLGGLSGVGGLVHRRSIAVDRPGTPNLIGIHSLLALAKNWADIVSEVEKLRDLRDSFERRLRERFQNIVITGVDLPRTPNVSHFRFPGFKKDLSLVQQLDLKGFALSAGSACASGSPRPSHVLTAMGLSDIDAKNALRMSLHPGICEADLTSFLDALGEILKRYEGV